MRVRLTPAFCRSAPVEAGRERSVYWDEALPGFGLVVTLNGARSFCVQYRAKGRSRRLTIDGVLSLPDARKEARALLGIVARGGDPLEERRQAAAAAKDTLRAGAGEYLIQEAGRLRRIRARRQIRYRPGLAAP